MLDNIATASVTAFCTNALYVAQNGKDLCMGMENKNQHSRSFSLRPDRPGNVPVSAGVVLTSDDFAPSSGGIWQGLEILWGQRMGGLLTSGGVTARDSPRSTKDLSPNVNSAKVEKP